MFHGPGWFGSIGLLILRVGFGGMMLIGHGWPKLKGFQTLKDQVADPLGFLETPYALVALIAAEFFCSALVVLGIGTRLAVLPLIYAMAIAAFVVHAEHPIFSGPGVAIAKEPALVYLLVFTTLFFTGAGRFSIDGLIARRRSAEA